MRQPKIGIYAGAFDPIHVGHVQFARHALAHTQLDRIYFLIEPCPRHKQGVKAFEHRAEMVRLAISSEPHMGLIVLDQARFTVHETWPVLQSRFAGAELAMLMGSDVFARLSHWPRVDELITDVRFVVGVRGGHDPEDFRQHIAMLEEAKQLRLRYTTFPSDVPGESSRHIRASLRRGVVPSGLDQTVAEYIQQHQLYSSGFSE